MRLYIYGIIYLWIAGMLDVVYTKNIIMSGNAVEANPAMAWVITNFGFSGLATVKTFWILVLFLLFRAMFMRTGKINEWTKALFFSTLFVYSLLVLYHFILIVMV